MCEILTVNNAKLIFSPVQGVESAALGIFFRVGSRFEKKSVKGIAHFLEHMVFKGSKKYSHRQIKQEIEGRGGHLNAFTAQEMTAYHANFLRKNLDRTLDILLDMVQSPLLRSSDVDKERNVILEEIKMYNDLPPSRAVMLLDGLLWAGHALGEEIIGYVPTVNSIQRKDLDAFRNEYYVPQSMVISCSGDLDKQKIVRRLQRLAPGVTPSLLSEAPGPCRGVAIVFENRPLEQSHLCLGFRSVSYRSKEHMVARLLNIILGANMSSRLFEELREKRSLCYEISSDIRYFNDSGAFMVHMGLDTTKIEEAMKAICTELEKIKEKEVGAKELSRAKDYLIGQLAMSLEVPQGRMWHFAQSYLTRGRIQDLQSLEKTIEEISAEQIRNLARTIFTFRNVCVTCVGNVQEGLKERLDALIRARP